MRGSVFDYAVLVWNLITLTLRALGRKHKAPTPFLTLTQHLFEAVARLTATCHNGLMYVSVNLQMFRCSSVFFETLIFDLCSHVMMFFTFIHTTIEIGNESETPCQNSRVTRNPAGEQEKERAMME